MIKENNITITHKHLLQEWDYKKNDISYIYPENYTYGSHKKVWWICKKNKEHNWEAQIKNRTKKNGTNCPYCCGQKVCQDNCLSTIYPYLLKEWDYKKNDFSPDSITSGSGKKIWWICEKNKNHSYQCAIHTKIISVGCPYCINRKVDNDNCLAKTHPHLLKEWDYEKNKIKPTEITAGSGKKIWWICKNNKNHKWRSTAKYRKKHSTCPICSNRKIHIDNCLATTHSFILEEWDYERNLITPQDIMAGSDKKVWWICKTNKNHKWNAKIGDRTTQHPTGCPFCPKIKGYSRKSIRWINFMAYKNNIIIQHAENGGEIKIKSDNNGYYSFDGFCEEINTVYEFYGCEFHGCPKCRNHNKKSYITGKKYYDSFCETIGREDFIRNKGYNLITIWECEWMELCKKIPKRVAFTIINKEDGKKWTRIIKGFI